MKTTMNKLRTLLLLIIAIATSAEVNAQKTVLKNNEIPKQITAFVNQNFSGNTIIKAVKDTEISKTEYEIKLKNRIELEFDASFKIKEIKTKKGVPTQLLSSSIVSYVKEKHPNAIILEWKKNRLGQEIELNNDLDIHFDKKGNIIK